MFYRFYLLKYENVVYVGKTTQTMKERFSKHKCKSNHCKSKMLINLSFNIDEIEHMLIHEIELSKEDSAIFENELIKIYKNDYEELICVNRQMPGRTLKEYREQNKEKIKLCQIQYREQNVEQIKLYQTQYNKQYQEQNKDLIKLYYKQYREQNKDLIKLYYKQYQEQNKEKIRLYQQEYREKKLLMKKNY